MARRLAVPQAVCIALAAVVVLMPELLAAIDVHLLSSWYQPRLGRVASISAALALPVVYLGLTTREPAVRMRRSVRYAPVAAGAAGAALVLCLVLPWILQRGLVIPTWIVDVVNALSVVAYVGFFTACAASLAARFVAARAEAVRAGVASGLPNESDADRARLEGIVLNTLRYRPVEQWMQQLTASCLAVCRVERASDGAPIGTGFLVAEGFVLTNHHVVHSGQNGERIDVQFRFDARDDTDGIVVRAEVKTVAMTESPSGGTTRDVATDSGPDELDFVVLKLDPAVDLLGRAPLRIAPAGASALGQPLLVLQHPLGESLQVCAGSIVGVNTSGTRLHHNATTQPGSSGSPCLSSMDLAVVAVHTSGSGSRHNNAVPFSRVVTALRNSGVAVPQSPRP